MTASSFFTAFLILLPSVWSAAQAVPTWFYSGWNHDPRFYAIYFPGFLAVRLVSGESDWVTPRQAVLTQDAAIAVLVTGVLAWTLARWRVWQAAPRLRAAVGLVSVALPWFGVVQPLEAAGRRGVAVLPLMGAYFSCILVAAFGPVTSGMRRSLLLVALASGVPVLVWGVDSWSWILAGSLLAAVLLLSVAAFRGSLAVAGSHNNELQRTKPAQAMELRR